MVGVFAVPKIIAATTGAGALEPGRFDPRGFRPLYADPASGEPVRFNACKPLHYVINPAHAPSDGVRTVHAAIESVAGATGLRFVYDGETTEPYSIDRPSYQPDRYGQRWAPILIAWSAQPLQDTASSAEAGDPIGQAGPRFEMNASGRPVLVTGAAIFDATDDTAGGARPAWRLVMIHELGHVMGLAHVPDTTSVMQPTLAMRPSEFGSGDWAGFRALGLGSSCVETPPLP